MADDAEWLKAAVRGVCLAEHDDCDYPDCKCTLQFGDEYVRTARCILTALRPLRDAEIAEAVGEEREACARVPAELDRLWYNEPGDSAEDCQRVAGMNKAADMIAAAIRERQEDKRKP